MFTTTQRTPVSMLPRHMKGRVSSRTLVAGRWVRSESEQARLAIFGRDEIIRINQASANARKAAAQAQWGRLLG